VGNAYGNSTPNNTFLKVIWKKGSGENGRDTTGEKQGGTLIREADRKDPEPSRDFGEGKIASRGQITLRWKKRNQPC